MFLSEAVFSLFPCADSVAFAKAFKAADRGSKALYNCLTKGFVARFSGADTVAFASYSSLCKMSRFLNVSWPFDAVSICGFCDSEWYLKQIITQETG